MIPIDLLAQLALGDLAPDDERAVEEHVLGCTDCARTLEGLVLAGTSVGRLLNRGGGQVFLTQALLERFEAGGLVTRRYLLTDGNPVACTVDAGDLFVLSVLEATLADVQRVDLDLGGHRIADVPFDRERGRIMFVAPGSELRKMPTMKLPIRALGPDERVLARWVLDHTAFAG